MRDLDILKTEAEEKINEAKWKLDELYDDAESVSAKIKLWFSINKRMVGILAGSHVVAFVIGLIC